MVEEEARAVLDELFRIAESRLAERGVGIGLCVDDDCTNGLLSSLEPSEWQTSPNARYALKRVWHRAFADLVEQMMLDKRLIPGQILRVSCGEPGELKFRVPGRPDGRCPQS